MRSRCAGHSIYQYLPWSDPFRCWRDCSISFRVLPMSCCWLRGIAFRGSLPRPSASNLSRYSRIMSSNSSCSTSSECPAPGTMVSLTRPVTESCIRYCSRVTHTPEITLVDAGLDELVVRGHGQDSGHLADDLALHGAAVVGGIHRASGGRARAHRLAQHQGAVHQRRHEAPAALPEVGVVRHVMVGEAKGGSHCGGRVDHAVLVGILTQPRQGRGGGQGRDNLLMQHHPQGAGQGCYRVALDDKELAFARSVVDVDDAVLVLIQRGGGGPQGYGNGTVPHGGGGLNRQVHVMSGRGRFLGQQLARRHRAVNKAEAVDTAVGGHAHLPQDVLLPGGGVELFVPPGDADNDLSHQFFSFLCLEKAP